MQRPQTIMIDHGRDPAARAPHTGFVVANKKKNVNHDQPEPEAHCDWLDPVTESLTQSFLGLVSLASPPSSHPTITVDVSGAAIEPANQLRTSEDLYGGQPTKHEPDADSTFGANLFTKLDLFAQRDWGAPDPLNTAKEYHSSAADAANSGFMRVASAPIGESNVEDEDLGPKSAMTFGEMNEQGSPLSPNSPESPESPSKSRIGSSSWRHSTGSTFSQSVKKMMTKVNAFRGGGGGAEANHSARKGQLQRTPSWKADGKIGNSTKSKQQLKEAPAVYHWQKAPPSGGSAMYHMRQRAKASK